MPSIIRIVFHATVSLGIIMPPLKQPPVQPAVESALRSPSPKRQLHAPHIIIFYPTTSHPQYPSPRQPVRIGHRALIDQSPQPQVSPHNLPLRLRRSCYPKSSMLVRNDIVFVFWVRGLVRRGDIDELVREVRGFVEFFEEVGEAGLG